MKKIIILIGVILFFINNAFSQLETSIEAKGIYGSEMFKPVKPGKSFSFKIKIKNNGDKQQRLYIDKRTFPNEHWIHIPYNDPLTISKGKTAIFEATANIPYGEPDDILPNTIYLFVKDNQGGYTSTYTGYTFSLLVDSTPPTKVSITKKYVDNNSVRVSVSAKDEIGYEFTFKNKGYGHNGVAKFDLKIKELSGKTIAKKEVKVKDSFDEVDIKASMKGNTTYKACITATDLAGNTSEEKFIEFTTPPSPPKGLNASNISVSSFKLNWNASDGATYYEIYDVTKKPKKIGETTSTHYDVSGLKMGEIRKYAVKAVSSNGESDYSEKLPVKTITVTIKGSDLICDTATYTIDSPIPITSIDWSVNTDKVQVSSSGVITKMVDEQKEGIVVLTAYIRTSFGDSFSITKKISYIGKYMDGYFKINNYTREFFATNFQREMGYAETGISGGQRISIKLTKPSNLPTSCEFDWEFLEKPSCVTGVYQGASNNLIIDTSEPLKTQTIQIRISPNCNSKIYTTLTIYVNNFGPYTYNISDGLLTIKNDESNSFQDVRSIEQDEVKREIKKVEIYNLQGNRVVNFTPSRFRKVFDVEIPISHLPSGFYALRVYDGKQWYKKKVWLK